MNFENRVENFAITILNHRIKVVFSAIILILLISSGIRFLETPSGYRGFVQDDFKYYQDILELEEKYGNISIALVLLASFCELIKLKYFFHLAGLTKNIGSCIAEHIPFKIP